MGNQQSELENEDDTSDDKSKILATPSSSTSKGIIVINKSDASDFIVHKKTTVRLMNCPTFSPLLKSSINGTDSIPLSTEMEHIMSHSSMNDLSCYLQDYLKECSEAVKFDQTSLNSRIKEVYHVSNAVLTNMIARQKTFSKLSEMSKKSDNLSFHLQSIHVNLEQSVELANDVNSLLPEALILPKLVL